jgi:hypothetical protein
MTMPAAAINFRKSHPDTRSVFEINMGIKAVYMLREQSF